VLDKVVVQSLIGQAHKRSYSPKHTVLHAGDVPTSLYLILEGSVSVLLEDSEGREVVLAYLGPAISSARCACSPSRRRAPRSCGRASSPRCWPRSPTRCSASSRTTTPDIMFEVAGQLAARLRDTSQRVGDLAFLDVAGRLAHILWT